MARINMKDNLICEENTIRFVLFSWINPRIAIKMNVTMPRNIFKCKCLEVKFAMVKIFNEECPRHSDIFLPIECTIKS